MCWHGYDHVKVVFMYNTVNQMNKNCLLMMTASYESTLRIADLL